MEVLQGGPGPPLIKFHVLDEADEGQVLEAGLLVAVVGEEEEVAGLDAMLAEVIHLGLNMVLQLGNRLQFPAITRIVLYNLGWDEIFFWGGEGFLRKKIHQALQFITFRYASTVDGSTNEMSKTIKLFVAFIYFAGPQKWLLYFT